jgi:hypothetical protein
VRKEDGREQATVGEDYRLDRIDRCTLKVFSQAQCTCCLMLQRQRMNILKQLFVVLKQLFVVAPKFPKGIERKLVECASLVKQLAPEGGQAIYKDR